MLTIHRTGTASALLLAIAGAASTALLAGCASTEPAVGDGVAATASPDPSPGQASPSYKEERWQKAIAGLNFDSGRVEVEPNGLNDPQQARDFFDQAMRELNRNDETAAVGLFRDALATWSEFPEAYKGLGDALRTKGRYEWAIASYHTALDTNPDDADTLFKVAMLLWAIDRQDEAIADMGHVLDLDQQRAEAHERLAVWNYYVGDYAEAWRHVHETRAQGGDVPPQFIPLLEAKMADPRSGNGGAGIGG